MTTPLPDLASWERWSLTIPGCHNYKLLSLSDINEHTPPPFVEGEGCKHPSWEDFCWGCARRVYWERESDFAAIYRDPYLAYHKMVSVIWDEDQVLAKIVDKKMCNMTTTYNIWGFLASPLRSVVEVFFSAIRQHCPLPYTPEGFYEMRDRMGVLSVYAFCQGFLWPDPSEYRAPLMDRVHGVPRGAGVSVSRL